MYSIQFKKTNDKAVVPNRVSPDEVGYDLTCIELVQKIGSKTYLFDTGIAIEPIVNGFRSGNQDIYTEIIPRSSLIKTGYILSNSVGIIDKSYRQSIKVALTKIDDSMPDLELPFTRVQLVIRKRLSVDFREVSELGESSRGNSMGFGSSDGFKSNVFKPFKAEDKQDSILFSLRKSPIPSFTRTYNPIWPNFPLKKGIDTDFLTSEITEQGFNYKLYGGKHDIAPTAGHNQALSNNTEYDLEKEYEKNFDINAYPYM